MMDQEEQEELPIGDIEVEVISVPRVVQADAAGQISPVMPILSPCPMACNPYLSVPENRMEPPPATGALRPDKEEKKKKRLSVFHLLRCLKNKNNINKKKRRRAVKPYDNHEEGRKKKRAREARRRKRNELLRNLKIEVQDSRENDNLLDDTIPIPSPSSSPKPHCSTTPNGGLHNHPPFPPEYLLQPIPLAKTKDSFDQLKTHYNIFRHENARLNQLLGEKEKEILRLNEMNMFLRVGQVEGRGGEGGGDDGCCAGPATMASRRVVNFHFSKEEETNVDSKSDIKKEQIRGSGRCLNCESKGHETVECPEDCFLRTTDAFAPPYPEDNSTCPPVEMKGMFQAKGPLKAGQVIAFYEHHLHRKFFKREEIQVVFSLYFFDNCCGQCGNPWHVTEKCPQAAGTLDFRKGIAELIQDITNLHHPPSAKELMARWKREKAISDPEPQHSNHQEENENAVEIPIDEVRKVEVQDKEEEYELVTID